MEKNLSVLPNNALDLTKSYLLGLQNTICKAIESLDGKALFQEDNWTREAGGGGKTRILRNGKIFESAGVNFSHISGASLPQAATQQRPELAGRAFDAMGVSLVFHPINPYVPTVHANLRFFVATINNSEPIWWFGGGYDLTPYYGFEEDCKHWHQTAYKACKPFGEHIYPHFKSWCDKYFYLKHRQEARGIGGLFFDDFNEESFEYSFNLTQSIGNHFLEAYIPIVERRYQSPFGTRQKDFQLYRRGRYVEFNLIYDRGTLFGLQSGGRTESILMSLPPVVHWEYNWQPEINSEEEKLYKFFLPPHDWITI